MGAGWAERVAGKGLVQRPRQELRPRPPATHPGRHLAGNQAPRQRHPPGPERGYRPSGRERQRGDFRRKLHHPGTLPSPHQAASFLFRKFGCVWKLKQRGRGTTLNGWDGVENGLKAEEDW